MQKPARPKLGGRCWLVKWPGHEPSRLDFWPSFYLLVEAGSCDTAGLWTTLRGSELSIRGPLGHEREHGHAPTDFADMHGPRLVRARGYGQDQRREFEPGVTLPVRQPKQYTSNVELNIIGTRTMPA